MHAKTLASASGDPLRMHRPGAAVRGVAHLVPSVAPLAHTNDIRASSSAQRTVSVPVTTRRVGAGPGSPFGPEGPAGPCAPWAPGGPAGPCGPCAPGGPAGPCGPSAPPRTRWALWTLFAARTRWALGTLRAGRTRWALWTLCAARTRWALRTRRGLAASRDSERHDEDRNAHQSHRQALRH